MTTLVANLQPKEESKLNGRRDIGLVKENVGKMLQAGAPEADIDGYIASEGYNLEEIQGHEMQLPEPTAAPAPTSDVSVEPKSKATSAALGAAHGASFGFDDETLGAVKALHSKLFGSEAEKDSSFHDLYTKHRDDLRKTFKEYEEVNPKSALAGEIAGSIGGGAGLLRGAARLGKSIGGRIGRALTSTAKADTLGKAVAQGTSLGALQGYGSAEDDVLADTGKGAALGAVGGTVGHGIAKGLGGLKQGAQKLLGIDQEAAHAFSSSGVQPTLADVSSSKTVKRFQNLLASTPWAAERVDKAVTRTVDDIEKQMTRIVPSEGGTIEGAGVKIQEGAKGLKGKLEQEQDAAYRNLDKYITKDTTVPLNNTRELIKNDEYLKAVSDTTPSVRSIVNRLDSFGGKDQLYTTMRINRTVVGDKLRSPTIDGDERKALRSIYDSMTADLKEAAAKSDPKALEAFNKANETFAKHQSFIEEHIDPLIENKTPEQAYRAAMAGKAQGGSNIKKIMKVLNSDQQEFVRASVIKKMGLANAGEQDAAGKAFSPSRFLSEWNKMSPEARQNLFTESQVAAVTNLNKAIINIKATSKTQNVSKNIPYLTMMGLGAGTITSHPAAVGGALVGGRISAELMTNPKFVNWLSRAPEIKNPGMFKKAMSQLTNIAARNPNIRNDIQEYVKSIQGVDETSTGDKLSPVQIDSNNVAPPLPLAQ